MNNVVTDELAKTAWTFGVGLVGLALALFLVGAGMGSQQRVRLLTALLSQLPPKADQGFRFEVGTGG
jgi:hypothetical protein